MIEDLFRNPLHLMVLLAVLVMLFGTSKLADAGKNLGKSIKEFKKEVHADDAPATSPSLAQTTATPADTAVRRCPSCGQDAPAGAQFCMNCGASLQVAQPPRCANCRAEVTPGSRFCMNCGQAVATGSAVAAGTAS